MRSSLVSPSTGQPHWGGGRNNSMKRSLLVVLAALWTASSLAQTSVHVYKADLSVPFGVVSGRLITVGEMLVFVDDERPDNSLAISRGGMRSLTSSGDTLTLETVDPVQDRTGARSRLSLRLAGPSDASAILSWYNDTSRPVSAPLKDNAPPEVQTYQVKHEHRFGSCNGRLMIEPSRIVFESITDIDHSRQWGLRDIKELKRDSPYGIKIVPFSEGSYNLGIQGRGMDSENYRGLVDRITASRTRP